IVLLIAVPTIDGGSWQRDDRSPASVHHEEIPDSGFSLKVLRARGIGPSFAVVEHHRPSGIAPVPGDLAQTSFSNCRCVTTFPGYLTRICSNRYSFGVS